MSNRVINNLLQHRAGGAVQRCHTVRHLGSYSVAEHSWGVAMLLLHLYPDHPNLLKYALVHDIPESLTGDVPSPAKSADLDQEVLENTILTRFDLPCLKDMTDDERVILNSCDRLELWIWAVEQLAMGNLFAKEITQNIENAIFAGRPLEARAQTYWATLYADTIDGADGIIANRIGLLNSVRGVK
jgi:5'-deoxynucleotidase YfbR-like HD superfamily hydrolase